MLRPERRREPSAFPDIGCGTGGFPKGERAFGFREDILTSQQAQTCNRSSEYLAHCTIAQKVLPPSEKLPVGKSIGMKLNQLIILSVDLLVTSH
ncbi:hypothetical protein PCASD_10376 [Puccinia coronata f. sp. avenae]|jgi:hypothetical protein|uniref:Uncharacterized protein n=1 Tax=Puccinia coronata f. sp. avenae TaxID=200324 RepID=A0A2N5URQ3_9BASI|nr:hypothetical protein PCASD_10376 [Puccinia coronata f. sp. avenae]